MEFPQGGNSIFCTLLVDNRAGAARHAVLGLLQKGDQGGAAGGALGEFHGGPHLGQHGAGGEVPPLYVDLGLRLSSQVWSGLPKLMATFSTAVRMMRVSALTCWASTQEAKSLSMTAAAPLRWWPSVL